MKSLDRKLAAIHADPSGCREFIIADAKDADTAMGDAKRNEHGDPEGAAVWLRLHEVLAEYVRAVRRHERAAS